MKPLILNKGLLKPLFLAGVPYIGVGWLAMMMIFSFASATGEHMFCENNEVLFFFKYKSSQPVCFGRGFVGQQKAWIRDTYIYLHIFVELWNWRWV